jgi:hypothetical protein
MGIVMTQETKVVGVVVETVATPEPTIHADNGVMPKLFSANGEEVHDASLLTVKVVKNVVGWPSKVVFDSKEYYFDPGLTRRHDIPCYAEV